MATVPVTLRGVIYNGMGPIGPYDVGREMTIVAVANLTGLSVGGGPMPGGGGPVDPGYSPPWAQVPVDPGYSPPWAQAPVDPGYSPPWARPPVPPLVPTQPPGTATPLPPPAGSAGWPVQPIVPPPYIVVNYPGVGPMVVTPPTPTPPVPPDPPIDVPPGGPPQVNPL